MSNASKKISKPCPEVLSSSRLYCSNSLFYIELRFISDFNVIETIFEINFRIKISEFLMLFEYSITDNEYFKFIFNPEIS